MSTGKRSVCNDFGSLVKPLQRGLFLECLLKLIQVNAKP